MAVGLLCLTLLKENLAFLCVLPVLPLLGEHLVKGVLGLRVLHDTLVPDLVQSVELLDIVEIFDLCFLPETEELVNLARVDVVEMSLLFIVDGLLLFQLGEEDRILNLVLASSARCGETVRNLGLNF